ncbi:hypothetical protein CPB85DRAFT_1314612 [Mucidula mucida]|nr:hypothetical protein CPB85DRAFT_1314612 [Mucidula mucida]
MMSPLPEHLELDSEAPADTPLGFSASDFRSKEPAYPLRIGAGSFAEAYKQMYGFDGAALRFEYDALSVIHECCDTDSFFAIPRPFAFNDPSGLVEFTTTCPDPPRPRRPRPVRPTVNQELLSIFPSPTYAMDRVHALPHRAIAKLSALYFPPTITTGPLLCRLYFGKSFTGARVSKFFNTENFPLDEDRYGMLYDSFPGRGAGHERDVGASPLQSIR